MTLALMLFFTTSLVVILTPGQDMLLVMSRSIALGRRAGVVTAAGVSTGLLLHTLLAVLGLGALLSASAQWFAVIKWIGAGYLVYLGLRLLSAPATGLDFSDVVAGSQWRLFFQGAVSNVSNPKVALFYFAFLPQFVPTDGTAPTLWIACLGIGFSLLTFLVKGPLGLVAGTLSAWLKQHPALLKGINRTSGGVMVGLGVRLALEHN